MSAQYQRKRIFLGEENNMVLRMILINAVIYLLLNFIKIVYYLSNASYAAFSKDVMPIVTLPASLHQLANKPWTLLTFMFVHFGFWHIAGNMLWLWWFGGILQDFAGYKKIVPLYLYGGLAGAAFYIFSYNVFPVFHNVLPVAIAFGASASVMAIAFAATVLVPDYRVFPMLRGGIPLWVITIIFVIIDMATIPDGNAGGHIAHLGGAIMGTIFTLQLKKGNDWSEWMSNLFEKFNNLFDPEKKSEVPIRHRLFYRNDVPPYKKVGDVPEKKIDELLDKINQHGYDSLSQEEKEILIKASRQND
jgi:membrane associated rhomboid family serine protease